MEVENFTGEVRFGIIGATRYDEENIISIIGSPFQFIWVKAKAPLPPNILILSKHFINHVSANFRQRKSNNCLPQSLSTRIFMKLFPSYQLSGHLVGISIDQNENPNFSATSMRQNYFPKLEMAASSLNSSNVKIHYLSPINYFFNLW